MELFSLNMTFPVIPFFFLLLLVIQIYRTIAQTPKNLPPGPCKFPIIGSLPHLVSSPQTHHVFRALAKKYGPIMHLQLGQVSTVVISSARLAKEVLKTHDIAVANRPMFLAGKVIMYSNMGLAPYGNIWRQMRKICLLELLSAKKVRSFSAMRELEVSRMIKSIRSTSGSPFDLGSMIYSLQNVIICSTVFGTKCKDQDTVIAVIIELTWYLGGFDVADMFPSIKFLPILTGTMLKLKKFHQRLDQILNDMIDEHRVKIGTAAERDDEDVVDVLLRLKESGELEFPLTLDNIKGIIVDVFAAGTENTATTIDWAMSEMIRNPRIMKKAQAEIREVFRGKKVMDEKNLQECSYLKMVIKETLRLHNPFAFLFPRKSREQFEVEGYTIPEKTNIIINFFAIARDPEYWHDPEIFLPERFENSVIDFKGSNFEFIPFGSGKRMCPGITFAMASLELILAQLLYHFDWKLPNGLEPNEIDMTELFGATIRRKNSLILVATPYQQP